MRNRSSNTGLRLDFCSCFQTLGELPLLCLFLKNDNTCCSVKLNFETSYPWLQVHEFLPLRKSWCETPQPNLLYLASTQRSQYLYVRHNVSLFVHLSQDWAPRILRSLGVCFQSHFVVNNADFHCLIT